MSLLLFFLHAASAAPTFHFFSCSLLGSLVANNLLCRKLTEGLRENMGRMRGIHIDRGSWQRGWYWPETQGSRLSQMKVAQNGHTICWEECMLGHCSSKQQADRRPRSAGICRRPALPTNSREQMETATVIAVNVGGHKANHRVCKERVRRPCSHNRCSLGLLDSLR